MDKETILEKCKTLEEELEDITLKITEDDIAKATEKEKQEYLKIISEIKMKIEMLKKL